MRRKGSATLNAIQIDTPVGRLTLIERDGRLARIRWRDNSDGEPTPLLAEAVRQLAAYFTNDLTYFDLPLAEADSSVATAARAAMTGVRYGRTATYGELAALTGVHPREFGQLCGANPLPIVVPCHRVLPANGFGHYSGGDGPRTKSWLLAHEGAALL